ncbi:hypothetical protein [Pseudomonas syringae]|uniref:hypothetical protein n=1 Tax=Pseudomonas syringae TaxID=317 RepID=UPI001F10D741|nr:hypothetical protein [Pseudomonas syringae]MCH5583107.1 hypothetical protein [Pseudomonas syringae pv. syringae]MCH5592794.1 hypothetical protein [Pseudomonas syringae pv. syringae]MDF5791045.1 hypothetical protein [Pseudomonas syringae pv. syringae]
MKVIIPNGSRNSGSVYYLDTDTNFSQNLAWMPPVGNDNYISFFANRSGVKAVLAGQGPTIYKAVVAELDEEAGTATVTPLIDTLIGNANMAVSPDGRFAVARAPSSNSWVIVDFSVVPPSIATQGTGTFPVNSSITMMSFDGGDNRLLVVDGDLAQMLLSTPIGSGQSIDTALVVPLSDVPAGEGLLDFAVNGTVLLGKLAAKASEAGFGNPTFIDVWIVASDGQGGYASARTGGLCTALSSGTQIMGYVDGVTLKEVRVSPDFSYSTTYSGDLPSGVSGGIFYTLPAPSNPDPVELPPFWTKFVRSFEQV